MKIMRLGANGAFLLTLFFGVSFAVQAAPTPSFYKDKTITIIVTSGAGGHFDRIARLVGHYLPDYLPVKEVHVVDQPGSGGIIGTNKIYQSDPDGLTIGITVAAGDVFSQMANEPGVDFDVTKFNWIGRADDDPLVLSVHRDSPHKTFAALLDSARRGRRLTALATGKGGFAYNAEVILFNAFEVPFNMVAAFGGSHQTVATFLAGQGDTIPLSASSTAQHLSNEARVVLTFTQKPYDRFAKTATVMDVAKQQDLPSDNQDALAKLVKVLQLGRAFFAPPGVPQARLASLRDAFAKVVHNQNFQADAKQQGLFIGYAGPDTLAGMVDAAVNNKALLQKFLRDN